MASRGGQYPEVMGGEAAQSLIVRLDSINALLEGPPSSLVQHGRNAALVATLHSQLRELSALQGEYFRAELEEFIFEIRRVATMSEYQTFLRQFFFDVFAKTGLARFALGTGFSTLQHLSSSQVKKRLKDGRFPVTVAHALARSGIKYFRRKFQQPLQDVVDGKMPPDAATQCCLFCS